MEAEEEGKVGVKARVTGRSIFLSTHESKHSLLINQLHCEFYCKVFGFTVKFLKGLQKKICDAFYFWCIF